MDIRIIIILAGAFALLQIFKIKDRFAQVINGLYALSFGLSFINSPAVRLDSFYLFGITHILVIIYLIHNNEFKNQKKFVIGVMAGIQLLSTLFILSRWPFAIEVIFLGIITIVAFLFALTRDIKSYKNEIGFMVVLAADAIVKLISILPSFGPNSN